MKKRQKKESKGVEERRERREGKTPHLLAFTPNIPNLITKSDDLHCEA